MVDSQTFFLEREIAPHYFHPGRFGAPVDPPGVVIELIADEDRLNVEARRGRATELLAALAAAFGTPPADLPTTVRAGGFDFIGVGPARWHAVSRGQGRVERRAALAKAVQGFATVVDLSHGFATFRVSGPKACEALSALAPIDFDPQRFAPGACALTQLHMMSVQIRRTPDGRAYECAVARSFGGSLFHALTGAAQRFGLSVESPVVA